MNERNRDNSKWELYFALIWQCNPLTCFLLGLAAPRKPLYGRSSWFASLWLCYWVFPGVWGTWCLSWIHTATMSWASSSAYARPHRCELLLAIHLYFWFCLHLELEVLTWRKTDLLNFQFFFQGLQIFIFFTARTPSFRAALKHCGHTIASASLTRAQTYHLWENFKKALSFESYKKCENDKSECTTMSDMNRSATSVEKKWLEWLLEEPGGRPHFFKYSFRPTWIYLGKLNFSCAVTIVNHQVVPHPNFMTKRSSSYCTTIFSVNK